MTEKRPRGRPASATKKEELKLKIPKGTKEYLRQAAATHLCGGQSANAAAVYLIFEGLNRLVEQKRIGPTRIFEQFPIDDESEIDPDAEQTTES